MVPEEYQYLNFEAMYREKMFVFFPIDEVMEWTRQRCKSVFNFTVVALMEYDDKDKYDDCEIKVSVLHFENPQDALQFKLTFF